MPVREHTYRVVASLRDLITTHLNRSYSGSVASKRSMSGSPQALGFVARTAFLASLTTKLAYRQPSGAVPGRILVAQQADASSRLGNVNS